MIAKVGIEEPIALIINVTNMYSSILQTIRRRKNKHNRFNSIDKTQTRVTDQQEIANSRNLLYSTVVDNLRSKTFSK